MSHRTGGANRESGRCDLSAALAALDGVDTLEVYGRVAAIRGLIAEVAGPVSAMHLGGRVDIAVDGGAARAEASGRTLVPCEVVGFQGERALVMPFGPLDGVRRGCPVIVRREGAEAIRPSRAWLGRTLDALARPIDGLGPLPMGDAAVSLRADPPPAHARRRVGAPLDLGIRCINTFTTMCRGQRMGIFAGSGVGKSVLLSMMARYAAADVAVIGLVGERGREVQEFLQDDLGPAGLARSVVVVATSDEPVLMRRNAAYATLAIAEYFRDQGAQVLCMIDSITRFAMAQRDIGLAGGEPPTAKGYTPTVFSELARLLERAGPGSGEGTISGLFTVLVEGDDHNEPVADAVRGILDGHIVMDRRIAERGRYPAIDVLRSVSRTMPRACDPAYLPTVLRGRRVLSTYADMEELIRLGAYRAGASADVDEAVALMPELEAFMGQSKEEATSIGEGYARLAAIVGG